MNFIRFKINNLPERKKEFLEIFFYVFLFIVLIYFVSAQKDTPSSNSYNQPIYSTSTNPIQCLFPISYNIGSLDENFNISKEDFKKALLQAEKIWEEPLRLDIFKYDENGFLKINLVFDERQAITKRLKKLLSEINNDEIKYYSLKGEYDALNEILKPKDKEYKSQLSEYENLSIEFDKLVNYYEEQRKIYEAEVSYWNLQGGAPDDKYIELTQKKDSLDLMYNQLKKKEGYLKQKFDLIEAKRQELNNLVDQINTVAGIMNRMIESLNLKGEKYNQTEKNRGEFEAGVYKGSEIDIYHFFDNQDLISTLAHELGHAIGLGHASSSESIMYYSVSRQNKLSQEDINLFKNKCGNMTD